MFRKPLVIAVVVGVCLVLSGCFATTGAPMVLARYDFGNATGPDGGSLALRGVDVQAPSWLSGPGMQYRLNYGDSGRRESFAASRWVAPPAELLENALRQRLVAGTRHVTTADCRLRVELDEFVQAFDRPQESRVILNMRLALLPGRGEAVLARRSLALSRDGGAEARTGATALSALAAESGQAIEQWLQQLATEDRQLAERCRGSAVTG